MAATEVTVTAAAGSAPAAAPHDTADDPVTTSAGNSPPAVPSPGR